MFAKIKRSGLISLNFDNSPLSVKLGVVTSHIRAKWLIIYQTAKGFTLMRIKISNMKVTGIKDNFTVMVLDMAQMNLPMKDISKMAYQMDMASNLTLT